ncbi:ATPase [Lysobacter maris]|uniref:ATPase n=1 Tax=Marilutibacter maris TaxID=1605891 RepID=A0A2U9T813_9GAMM|nr:ATPase [Lysobacter maris]
MNSQHFHVITGASGAGKSSLLAALSALGHSTVPEVALAILREQRAGNGRLLPGVDRAGFMEALLLRSIEAHRAAAALPAPVFFDRGVPECVAWMRLMGLEAKSEHLEAAARCRYAGTVFVAEPWPEIYVRDGEREASFERAARSFAPTVAAYVEAGYRICILPKVPVRERVAFVLAQLGGDACGFDSREPREA